MLLEVVGIVGGVGSVIVDGVFVDGVAAVGVVIVMDVAVGVVVGVLCYCCYCCCSDAGGS